MMENLIINYIIGIASSVTATFLVGFIGKKIYKHFFGSSVRPLVGQKEMYISTPVTLGGVRTVALWNAQDGGNYGVVPFGSKFLVCSGLGPNNPDVIPEREFDSIESAVRWIERKRKKGA